MNIELSITEQCNLRCSYCYYRETHGKRCAVMSDEVMEATVRLAVKKTIEFQDSFYQEIRKICKGTGQAECRKIQKEFLPSFFNQYEWHSVDR